MSLDRLVDLMPAVAFFVLAAYFWRTKRRQPRSDIWMIPTLALIVGATSFWIAEQADSWPMAVAGLAAYLLALTFVRVPRRVRQLTVAEIVFDPSDDANPYAELEGAPSIEAKTLAATPFRSAPETGRIGQRRRPLGLVSKIDQ
jgi:hypothetical protein